MANILLIDDDRLVRYTLRQALENEGHIVTEASNGQSASASMEEATFDLVITDIIMPEMDGIETVMALRDKLPNSRIIAISGGGRGENYDYLKLAKSFGADRTLRKPFRCDELVELVSSMLAED